MMNSEVLSLTFKTLSNEDLSCQPWLTAFPINTNQTTLPTSSSPTGSSLFLFFSYVATPTSKAFFSFFFPSLSYPSFKIVCPVHLNPSFWGAAPFLEFQWLVCSAAYITLEFTLYSRYCLALEYLIWSSQHSLMRLLLYYYDHILGMRSLRVRGWSSSLPRVKLYPLNVKTRIQTRVVWLQRPCF